MSKAQDISTKSYILAAGATTASEALLAPTVAGQVAVIFNDSTESAFVVAGATAVLPTDNNPIAGKMIGSKQTQAWPLPIGTTALSCIQPTAGTGSVYFSIGEGV